MVAMSWGLTPANTELSDEEITSAYGSLIKGAVAAFKSDPSYLIDMAEHASLIEYKRSLWRARAEATSRLRRQQECPKVRPAPEDVRLLATNILAEWGVCPPNKFSRGSRRKRSDPT